MKYLTAIFLVLLSLPATGDNRHDDGDVDVSNTITGGDVSLSGGDVSTNIATDNKTFAFAHGMGDVDINQCMGSTQWSTILVSKQKLLPNLWCMGESYDARGLHHMAALVRCDIDMIRKHFDSDETCVQANTITPQLTAMPTVVVDDDEETHRELEQSYTVMQSQIADLQALVERSQRPVVRREVVEKGGLTDEQRAKLREVVK